MNLKPINDQVIVLADPRPEQIGRIIVPDVAAMDNPNWFPETGRVVALGRTAFVITPEGEIDGERPFDCAVGDRVHFNRYAGKQVTCDDDGVTYLVMREHEIDLVLDETHVVFHGYQPAQDEGIASYDRDPFAGM